VPTPGLYNLGPQQQIVITRSDTLATVTLDGPRSSFDSKDESELVKDNTIDMGGIVYGMRVPGGWSGTIEVEKQTDAFDALMEYLDQNYFDQGAGVWFTIVETVTPADPTQAPYQNMFSNVVFHGYNRGKWERASITKPSVSFFASTLQAV
jgi:hypothetical protein